MKQRRSEYAFTDFLEEFFLKLHYTVEKEVLVEPNKKRRVDLIIKKNDQPIWVEVKFYRDDHVDGGTLTNAALQLLSHLKLAENGTSGLVIVSAYVSQSLKEQLTGNFGIMILDRSDIFHLTKNILKDDKLLEYFEQLILEAKQGLDIREVFKEVEKKMSSHHQEFFYTHTFPFPQKESPLPPKRGAILNNELNAIPPGKTGWRQFELKCIEILKYLFGDDLSKWDEQKSTDDELSRFDMICKVKGHGDFWSSLIQSFQSRYVLFEFKNYTDPIGQDQIYTTERYLYLRGLRSVGFIISRAGGTQQAWKAAKGALREHGKLIIILDNNDLSRMLEMEDMGDIPRDHLSDKLDDFLISLSR